MKRTFRFCLVLSMLGLLMGSLVAQSGKMNVSLRSALEQKPERLLQAAPVEKQGFTKEKWKNAELVRGNEMEAAATSQIPEQEMKEMVRAYMKSAFANRPARTEGSDRVFAPFMQAHQPQVGYPRYTFRTWIAPDSVNDETEERLLAWLYSGYDGTSPSSGAWCGSFYQGFFQVYDAESKKYINAGYFVYDPAADEVENVKISGAIELIPSMSAYNPKNGYIYTLTNMWGKTSFDSTDVQAVQAGTGVFLRLGKLSGLTAVPVSMAIDKEGVVYIVASDGNLYTMNNDLSVTLVGATGILTDTYNQSAALDMLSGNIYWAYMGVDDEGALSEIGIANINTTTGAATKISTDWWQVPCMTSLYNPDKNPMAASSFALVYDPAAKKVKAAFTTPEEDVNGFELAADDIAAVKIYRVGEDGNPAAEASATLSNPEPGKKYEVDWAITETEGTQTYAVQVENKAGKKSYYATKSVMIINITLPYTTGFEEDDKYALANISFKGTGNGLTTEDKHEGSRSVKIKTAYNAGGYMAISALPVRKGEKYGISFWAKSKAATGAVVYGFNEGWAAYIDIKNTWEQQTITYTAEASGQFQVKFAGLAAKDTLFVDDVEVKKVSDPAPMPMVFKDIKAAPNGAMNAIVTVTLPTKDAAEDPLNAGSITSVVFKYTTETNFSGVYYTDTIRSTTTTLTPGATVDLSVKIPKAAQYIFLGYVLNGDAVSDFSGYRAPDGYLAWSPWLGPDKVQASLTVKTEVKTDGTTRIYWPKVQGAHEGYVGTITYTLKKGDEALYTGTDTTYTLSNLKGLQQLKLYWSQPEDTASKTVYTLTGLTEKTMFNNVNTSAFTVNNLLNVMTDSIGSHVSQMAYPATGRALYIDTLQLFSTAPTTGEVKRFVKIYMGVRDTVAFKSGEKDMVEKDQMQLVYADTLRFKAGENTLKLPLMGYYYDGKKPFVITLVSPKQAAASASVALYRGEYTDPYTMKYIFRKGRNSIDLDTVARFNAYTNSAANTPMAMVAQEGNNLKALQVTVKDQADNALVAGAQVRIYSHETKATKPLDVTLTANEQGVICFNKIPKGNYYVKAQKAAYITDEMEVEITDADTTKAEIKLLKAAEVNVSGVVKNYNDQVLEGVKVTAKGLADFEATTGADGAFTLEKAYGPGEYELVFEKLGMETLKMSLKIGKNDTTIGEVKMHYAAYQVVVPKAEVNASKAAVITWQDPAKADELSWTKDAKMTNSLKVDGKAAFKYAQRFTAADLRAAGMLQMKAVQIGFVPGSETARYTLVLATDTTHELARVAVDAEKVRQGEWYFADVTLTNAIEQNRQLWLIVEVAADAAGNQGNAAGLTSGIAKQGQSNLVFFNNKWNTIDKAFSGSAVTTTSVLVSIKVKDEATSMAAVNGYKVYRGPLSAGTDLSKYTLLTNTNLTANTYTDNTYAAQTFGQYRYAVVSDWFAGKVSAPALTNVLNKDMEMKVTVEVTSNTGSAKGAEVLLANANASRTYRVVLADESGKVELPRVWRDTYTYTVSKAYHATISGSLNLTKDTTLRANLIENTANANITKTEVRGKDVVMTYALKYGMELVSVKVLNYEIYLDGNKVGTSDTLVYTYQDLAYGKHKVGVKAVFASGATALAEKEVNVSAEAMPIDLKVAEQKGGGVFTWDMPAGYAPVSYKVYLNDELKAENLTEKTYTFSGLKKASYTAAVVAVYATGESEKAEIRFTVKEVGVEDFALAAAKLYPNPNNGIFYLQTPQKAIVDIFSLNGRLVSRKVVSEGVHAFNLAGCARGMYLVKLSHGTETKILKLIVR